MTIEKKTVELRKIVAEEGMLLTNGEICVKTVYLGENDAPENWREITEEEAEAIKDQQKETRDGINESENNDASAEGEA